MFATLLAILTVTCLVSSPVIGSPLAASTRPKRAPMTMTDYLTSFGYIDKDAMSASNLRSGEDLKRALKTLQKTGHIPETGKMDAATMALMSKPRCGMSDTGMEVRGKRYVHGDTRWEKREITWSLDRTPSHLRRDNLRRDVNRAFEVWARNSSLTFHERDGDPTADIQIAFHAGNHGDRHDFDGPGMVLAHAFGPDKHNEIGGDTHFDAEEEWTLEYKHQEGTHFFMVAVHEFGHSLGLKHSDVEPSIMSPWYSGSDAPMLEQDDIVAIQLLYGKGEEKGRGREPARERPDYQAPREQPYPPRPPPQARPSPRGYPTPRRNPAQREPPEERPAERQRPTSPQRPEYRAPQRPYRPEYRPVQPSQPTTSEPSIAEPGVPRHCDISYDAVSMLRGELFIFKDDLIWRVRVPEFENQRDPPSFRKLLWKGLPDGKIDAVYERPNGDIVFFVGRHFYVFSGTTLRDGPLPLTYLGLPDSLTKVDAATRWKERTFLFAGTSYWKLDEDRNRVESDYPRQIDEGWTGLTGNIDAAMQWKDKSTYFFKGKHFWRYDDERMRVEDIGRSTASYWMNCNGSSGSAKRAAIGSVLLPLLVWYACRYSNVIL